MRRWKKSDLSRFITLGISVLIIALHYTLVYLTNVPGSSDSGKKSILLFYCSIFSAILYRISKLMLLFPLLLSRYKPISYLLKMRSFNLISKLLTPIMVLLPSMFLRYYYGMSQMLTINYYQMAFYAIGTYCFCIPFAYFAHMMLRAPIDALLTIH